MRRPAKLRYHRFTFDLLRREPVVSPAAVETLRKRQRLSPTPFPPAVCEWYFLDGAVKLLRDIDDTNDPLPLSRLKVTEHPRPRHGPPGEKYILFNHDRHGVGIIHVLWL